MSDIIKTLISKYYNLYFIAHASHLNVEGIYFNQLHEFFGEIYEDAFAQVDRLAEENRYLDVYFDSNFVNILLPNNKEYKGLGSPLTAFKQLIDIQNDIILSLLEAITLAQEARLEGFAAYLQERVAVHTKSILKLTSLSK